MPLLTTTVSKHPAWAGSGILRIRHLRFEARPDVRDLDLEHVNTLIHKFKTDPSGCEPFLPRNRVPVISSRSQIRHILSHNRVTLQRLRSINPPRLDLSTEEVVICLHGRHRLAAAEGYLEPAEQWWGVEFYYEEDLVGRERDSIRCTDQGEQPYNHGTIFQNIRHLQNSEQREQADWWWAKLSESCSRDLKQFQDGEIFTSFREALDNLLPYRGLWYSFHLGVFHRLLPMKLLEEYTHYLKFMSDVWGKILGDISPQHLDLETVRYLEGRSPYYSTEDQLFIRSYFESKLLFPSVTSSSTRDQILVRVCAIKTIIPSLRTFQEDTIWLEPCWKILRKLLPPKTKGTLQKELRKSYTRLKGRRLPVQTTESTINIRPGIGGSGFWFAYRQLILIAQRHFPCMTEIRPRKGRKRGEIKARYCHVFQKTGSCWSHLARLALQLGFSNDSIKQLLRRDSTPEMCVDPLPEEASPQVTVNTKERWRIEGRCGRVFERAFHNDRRFIFLDYVYSDIEINPRQAITSFGTFRHIFHAFFGSSVPFAESFHSKSPGEQSFSLNALHYSPDISPSGSDRSRTRSTPDQDIDMVNLDDGEDGEDGEDFDDGSNGSSNGSYDDGDNKNDDNVSMQDASSLPVVQQVKVGQGKSTEDGVAAIMPIQDASSLPVVQQVKVGQGQSTEGGLTAIMPMYGMIESLASQGDKHSTTFFPGGGGTGSTNYPISTSGENTTLPKEARDIVLSRSPTNEAISTSGENAALPKEAREIVLLQPLTNDETNPHDPTKHTTIFPGARSPQPPQSLNTDFQFPSGSPKDSHEASPSNRRKRKSPESPMVPVPSNPDDPLTLQTGIEQVPYLLERLQTTESQVPHCLVYVSPTEPTEYEWHFYNQIRDSQYLESTLQKIEKMGRFFTFGDLTRRQFSTISVEGAVTFLQAGTPIFVHLPTINFRNGFPSPLNESERTFDPEIPRWNTELHRWTLTSKKSKGSPSTREEIHSDSTEL